MKKPKEPPVKLDHHFRMPRHIKALIASTPAHLRRHFKAMMVSALLNSKGATRFVMTHTVPKPRGYEGI